MKVRYIILIAIILLLLMGVVTADVTLTPDKITVSLNRDWPIANGIDQVTITAHPYNTTNVSVVFPGQPVFFSVNNSALGRVNPVSSITGSNGNAVSTFTTSTKSGVAEIIVFVIGSTPTISNTTYLNIDHGDPYEILTPANYTGEQTVGETIEIKLKLVDKYGNLIDNKGPINPAHPNYEKVDFQVTSPEGGQGAYFKNFTTSLYTDQTQTLTVNESGIVFTTLKVDTVPGDNIVWVRPLSPAPDDYFTVTGVANGEPWYIDEVFPTTDQPADGVQLFKFTYYLWDKYRNPLANKGINWTAMNISGTELKSERPIYTNQEGWAERTYGPSTAIGPVYMAANPVENKSIWANQTLYFVATDPTNMVLTAAPQSMASRDVPSYTPSIVTAKVMDAKGNPVKNELVNFTIIPNSIPEWQIQNASFDISTPLLVTSATTNSNGDASVNFYPGKFKVSTDDGYVEIATANCSVKADWKNETVGISKNGTVFLEWKNYPWLSVESSVNPKLVPVNGTVEVTLKLIGNGWALQPKPVDVMLVIDRSGSMTGTDISPSRMAAARTAAKKFVGQMNLSPSQDRVGLVSFAADATLNQGLTDNPTIVNASIDSLNPVGGTMLRNGYYLAIKELKQNGRTNAVKAVVVMTDGDWNLHGSPLAKGYGYNYTPEYNYNYDNPGKWPGATNIPNEYQWYDFAWYGGNYGNMVQKSSTSIKLWYSGTQSRTMTKTFYRCDDGGTTLQNMSVFATDGTKKVKVYSIGFASNLNDDVEADLTTLSNATTGWYQWAGDSQALNNLYTQIAGELKNDAGVNMVVGIDYDDVIINSTRYAGGDVFTYIPYSRENLYWHNVIPNVNISPYPKTTNNSPQWVSPDFTLTFNITKIKLHQTWEVVYTLKVLKEGNINVFGNNSLIRFNDGATLNLPDTYITAAYNLTTPALANPNLELSDLQETVRSDMIREWTWERNYTGSQTLTEKYYISLDNGQRWIQIGDGATEEKGVSEGKFVLDLTKIPGAVDAQDTILFRVVASAIDVGSPVRIQQRVQWNHKPDKIYIKLE